MAILNLPDRHSSLIKNTKRGKYINAFVFSAIIVSFPIVVYFGANFLFPVVSDRILLASGFEMTITNDTSIESPSIFYGRQTGAGLSYQGESLIDLGAGFGLPVVVTNGEWYIPVAAHVENIFPASESVVKHYLVDGSLNADGRGLPTSTEEIISVRIAKSGPSQLSVRVTHNMTDWNYSVFILNGLGEDFKQYFDSQLLYFYDTYFQVDTQAQNVCFTNTNGVRFNLRAQVESGMISGITERSLNGGTHIAWNITCIDSFDYILEFSSKEDRHLFLPTDGHVISSPVPVLEDKDGNIFFAVGDWDGWLHYRTWNLATAQPAWSKLHKEGIFASPASFIHPFTDRASIAVTTENGSLVIYDFNGTLLLSRPFAVGLEPRIMSSPTFTGTGLAFLGNGLFYYVDMNGDALEGWPQPVDDWGLSSPGYYPVGVFSEGIISVTTLADAPDVSDGYLYAWWTNGTLLSGYPIHLPEDSDSSPSFADINADEIPEIIVGDDGGNLHAFTLMGLELTGFPVRAESLIEASPAIGSTSPNGTLFIAIGSWDSSMYVIDSQGNTLQDFPLQTQDHIISSAALVDIDGNGQPEIIAGSKDCSLYIWHLDGSLVPYFPLHLGSSSFSSPLAMDLDGNGFIDIVTGANNGIHVILDVGVGEYSPWPMFKQNPWHTGTSMTSPGS
ncbi:MAG: FG-GAP-like repeat-containing protein [Candidatus Thorarchaeota archaeon]